METAHRKTSRKTQVPMEDDIRNDMRRMKIVKWTEHVQDRPKWKVIVEKSKTLPEL
jgi:hypothetical protein